MPLHPQTAAAMGNLLHKLSSNPKTRAQTLQMIKEVEPGYKLPADVAVENLRKEIKDDLAKDKREAQIEAAKNRRARDRNKLVEVLGEDEVKKIDEGVLKKYPHLSYDDAAKLHRADESPARPNGAQTERARHGQIWEFPDLPGLLTNPEKAATDAAYAVIDELRGR